MKKENIVKTASPKEIDYRFKILYAFGIIMVCSGHVEGGGGVFTMIRNLFPYYGYHLALFVFCSGYFYKYVVEEHIGEYIIKKIKNLVLPLYIYTIVYSIIVQVLKLKGFDIGGKISFVNIVISPITTGHCYVYNLGGWFITPLFMVEVYNVFIHKFLHRISKNISETTFFIIGLVLGLIGNYLASKGYNTGWWLVLVRMLYFVPFYELGIFYKVFLEKYDRKIPSIWYFSAALLLRLLISYGLDMKLSYTAMWCNNFTEGPLMPIVVGFLGIAFWMRIATLLEPKIGKNKWINIIADNTYSIMMNHLLGFMLVKTVYALLSKVNVGFSDFDWVSYKTDVFWCYAPKGLGHTLYVVVGITFSIIVQELINSINKCIKKLCNKQLLDGVKAIIVH